jgi:pimeloyl-ACP methyl ester carboxylesterase
MARPAMREMFVRNYAEAARQGVTAFADEVILASKPWGFRLQDITTPVRLWHGEEDRSTPIAMVRAMAAAIPNCRTTFLPGEGHLFLFDRWGEILGDLLSIATRDLA